MNNFYKMKRKQETDFHSVEINTAHFDTVKCECFIMQNLKKVMKSPKIINGFLTAQKSTNPDLHGH